MTPEDPRTAPRQGAPRELLLGLLASQHLIDRETLLSAFNDWRNDPARSLGQILVDRGALAPGDLAMLESLTAAVIDQSGGDVTRALASRGMLSTVRTDLERLHDPDLEATLSYVPSDQTTAPFSEESSGPGTNQTYSSGERFRWLRSHAQGGQGEVHVFLDENLNREVALKRLRAEYAHDPAHEARLVNEAEITARLEHPGFVPVHAAGQDESGRFYYVMRLIRGETLEEAIKRYHDRAATLPPGERALGLRELLQRFLDVCNALGYAHDRGQLHRDIKPGNILLGPFGETLIVDLGLAKTIQRPEGADPLAESIHSSARDATETRGAVGTLVYMSPEQLEGGSLDVRSDIYNLGATLYTLLTGTLAFRHRELGEIENEVRREAEGADSPLTPGQIHRKALDRRQQDVMARIRGGTFPRPRAVNRDVAPALEAICLKAMAVRPEGRYATAAAVQGDPSPSLADDLNHWLADEPVAAYTEPWPRRAARWARHHQAAVAATAALLVTALAALGVSNVLVRHEQQRTETARQDALKGWGQAEENLRLAREAERRAEESRDQAEANFRLERESRKQIYELAAIGLAYLPESEPYRRTLADAAVTISRKALALRPDEPTVRLDLARDLRVSADTHRLTGEFDIPRRNYHDAIELGRRLPQSRDIQGELVRAYVAEGNFLLVNGLPGEAERAFSPARELADALPRDAAAHQVSALVRIESALLHYRAGDYEKARSTAEEAATILKTPAGAESPYNLLYRSMIQTVRGMTFRETGQTAEAEKAFNGVIKGLDPGAQQRNPAHDDFQAVLGNIRLELGELLVAIPSRAGEALREYARASETFDQLARRHPANRNYRQDCAIAHDGLGGALLALHRLDDAERECAYARTVALTLLNQDRRPGHRVGPDVHTYLGRTLGHLARIARARDQKDQARQLFDEAIAEHEKALALNPQSARDRKLAEHLRKER